MNLSRSTHQHSRSSFIYKRPQIHSQTSSSPPHHPLQSHLPIQLSNNFPLFQSKPTQSQWSSRPSLFPRLPPVVVALSCKYPTCTPRTGITKHHHEVTRIDGHHGP